MRLPWDRSKPPQLDLLGPEEPAPIAETPAKALTATPDAPPQEVSHMPVVEPLPVPTGEPLLIPLSALCEDPDNPRTEFPAAELQELAEDIRQHGILQPIVVRPADADGRYVIHFGAKRFRAAGLAGLGFIPDSMSARSYIVRGEGHADSFESCSHGAGRVMSRGEAKRSFTLADHRAATWSTWCTR